MGTQNFFFVPCSWQDKKTSFLRKLMFAFKGYLVEKFTIIYKIWSVKTKHTKCNSQHSKIGWISWWQHKHQELIPQAWFLLHSWTRILFFCYCDYFTHPEKLWFIKINLCLFTLLFETHQPGFIKISFMLEVWRAWKMLFRNSPCCLPYPILWYYFGEFGIGSYPN